MKKLNQKATDILSFIRRSTADGVPPTVREICSALNIKSTSTVHRYLGELEQQGFITRSEGLNRSIRLAGSQTTLMVPLLGRVTAGQPILAFEDVTNQLIPFHGSGNPEDFFALRIQGESMINAGILDGDIIVVRKTETAENGQIVVALIEEEATVKRFYKEKGHYRLQPENDTMEPIIVDDVRILGRVAACVRHYES